MPILGIIASQDYTRITSSYESIASATGTGSSGTITISSIPATYKHLQLRWMPTNTTAGQTIYMRVNSDTGANYAKHLLVGTGTAVSASGTASTTSIEIEGNNIGSGTTYPACGITDIIDYASTTKYKTLRALALKNDATKMYKYLLTA